jgi:hypothetical protein
MNWIQEWQQQAEAEIARKEAKAKARDAQNAARQYSGRYDIGIMSNHGKPAAVAET